MKHKIEDKLDRLWQKAIKKRDETCRWNKCNQPSSDSHHYFGRRNRSTRWLLLNGCGLCRKHHNLFHMKPTQGWLNACPLTHEQMEELERLSNSISKYPDYEWIESELKAFISL